MARCSILLGALGGCLSETSVSNDVDITCTDDGDCPGEMVCDPRHGRCQFELSKPVCGDGIVDEGEACDCGSDPERVPDGCASANSDTRPNRCRTNCQLAGCGDGVVDANEACDDGNLEPGDGCSIICEPERCGNGVLDAGEVCDDGNVLGGDGCSADCRSDEQCNNGITDFDAGELCDCGDGSLSLPAGCEAPNGAAGGSCTADCKTVFCGNGVLNDGEACDDGNTTSGDGCSGDCLSDESCGNGYVDLAADPPEGCDLGAANANTPDALCRTDCTPRRCGDGIIDPASGEDCEAGSPLEASCMDFGYYTGTLGCGSDCRYDPEGTCTGSCGDGVVTFPELCDGAPTRTCVELGYDAGLPTCTDICNFGVSACHRFGWQPESLPSLTSSPWVEAIHGSAADDVWAVGVSGFVLHYDGIEWSRVDSGVSANFNDVWAVSESSVYMVGSESTIRHYDGDGFESIDAQSFGVDLYGVSAASDEDVFFVGDDSNTGRILHYDGESVTSVYDLYKLRLQDVFALSSTNVYAVGYSLLDSSPRIVHYDGETWSTQDPGVIHRLNGVHATGPDDVWAVGVNGVVLRNQGSGWVTVVTPVNGLDANNSVVASGTRSIRVGGKTGAVLRFNGAVFVEEDLGQGRDLVDLWASPEGTVFGVGNATSGPMVMRYSGREFLPPAEVVLVHNEAYALWGVSPTEVWLAEEDRFHSWNGADWTRTYVDGAGTFKGMWGTASDDIIAVGLGGGFANEARIFRYGGSSWSDITPSGPPAALWDIDGADGLVLAVGEGGTILRRTGSTTFAAETSGVSDDLYGVAVLDATRAYAAGNGVVLTFDGSEWSTLDTGAEVWRDIWVAPTGEVLVIGDDGKAARYDGGWEQLDSGTSLNLEALWGTAADDIFAVGEAGTVLHYDGAAMAPVRTTFTEDFTAIWGQLGGDVFLLGWDSFQVLHYEVALGP